MHKTAQQIFDQGIQSLNYWDLNMYLHPCVEHSTSLATFMERRSGCQVLIINNVHCVMYSTLIKQML